MLQQAISKAKNESFQEYVSSLDHTNQNVDVYRTMPTVGSRNKTTMYLPCRCCTTHRADMLGEPAVLIAKEMNATTERWLISRDSIDILPYCCPSNMITGTQLSELVKYGCKDGYSIIKARIYVVSS